MSPATPMIVPRTVPGSKPPVPSAAPDLVPETDTVLIGLEIDALLDADIRIGVTFGAPPVRSRRGRRAMKIYVYLSPPLVHVGSIVLVPPSAYCADVQEADVVTLDPPPYHGPLKRVLAVLT